MPESRSTWFWIMSNPPAVVGSQAIQSTPIIPPRREGSGRGWRSPRGPQCLALVCWHVWQDRTYSATSTSWPTQKARRHTSDPVLARPKCPLSGPLWHSRSTCATVRQPAAGRDAEAVRLTLPAAVQQAVAHQGWQGRRGARGAGCQKRAPRGGALGAVKKCRALLGSMMRSILFDLRVRTGSAWPGRGPVIEGIET